MLPPDDPNGVIQPNSATPQAHYRFRLSKDKEEPDFALPINSTVAFQQVNLNKGLQINGAISYKTVFSDDLLNYLLCWKTSGRGAGITINCPADPEEAHKSLTR